jgi:hypothetical protein
MVASLMETCSMTKTPQRHSLTFVYTAFVSAAMLVYHLIAEGRFSSLLTLSAIVQCLGFSLLAMQVFAGNNVSGISANSLKLDALALACRLSSTLWFEGYLPVDKSGDHVFQAFDILSLGMVLWLLYRVLNVHRHTYEEHKDTLPALPFAAASLLLASMLHGNLDGHRIFDISWMCGVFISAAAVLPQLLMMTRRGGSIPPLTSHFVAVMAVSRILSGCYMWHAYPEIECEPWIGNFNHAGYSVIAAHAVHLFLLGDFAYFYGRNIAKSGWNAPLDLRDTWSV